MDYAKAVAPDTEHRDEPTGQLVNREPGDVVLRAERIEEEPAAQSLTELEYNRQAPRTGELFPYGVNWARVVCVTLLLLIVILVIVDVVTFPRHHDHNGAKMIATKSDLTSLAIAIGDYYQDTGQLPSNATGLSDLINPSTNVTGWKGAYLKSIPADSWGMPYLYVAPGTHNVDWCDLSSAGPDMKFGTSDDIGNW